ncbi:MAG: hypothetical protein WKF93_11710 [Acidimicrobiales bacterium]
MPAPDDAQNLDPIDLHDRLDDLERRIRDARAEADHRGTGPRRPRRNPTPLLAFLLLVVVGLVVGTLAFTADDGGEDVATGTGTATVDDGRPPRADLPGAGGAGRGDMGTEMDPTTETAPTTEAPTTAPPTTTAAPPTTEVAPLTEPPPPPGAPAPSVVPPPTEAPSPGSARGDVDLGGGSEDAEAPPATEAAPATAPPTTAAPTTAAPTTAAPTTVAPTTAAPTTVAPTTAVPSTTVAPSTPLAPPTTDAPSATGTPPSSMDEAGPSGTDDGGSTTAEVAAQSGDSMWSITEQVLEERLDRAPTTAEIAQVWNLVLEANADQLPEPGNPDLIYVGQTVFVPVGPTLT